jgi:hypothetical protein
MKILKPLALAALIFILVFLAWDWYDRGVKLRNVYGYTNSLQVDMQLKIPFHKSKRDSLITLRTIADDILYIVDYQGTTITQHDSVKQ